MFDGSVQTFERLKRPNSAQVIATTGDKIILLDEQQPDSTSFIGFPGGRIDKEKEEPLEGAKRELLEETGYVSDDWEPWLEISPMSKIEWTIYTFIARNCRKIAEPRLDAGERIALKFMSFDDFLALPDNDSFHAGEITEIILRARLDKNKRSELSRLLF